MICKKCERPMVFWSQFRFEREPGDEPHVVEQLARFKAMGLDLGALVKVYRCVDCDTVTAVFDYGD
jgi:hypothetical protein